MWKRSASVLVLLGCAASAAAQAPQSRPSARLLVREGSLELDATWERVTDTVYRFEQKFPLVGDLAPAVPRERHAAERFQALLPAEPVAVGDVWRIDPVVVLPFLRQFHPGATAELHHDGGMGFGAHGGFGVLAALDAGQAEVRVRVHAEFLLAGDGGRASSWFTPAQFRGRLRIDRQRGEVIAFQLEVPAQSANVDINVAQGDGVVCDIGRIPRMELSGGAFLVWSPPGALTDAEADDRLARRFYPFAAIDWLDLPAARAESRRTGKPLHVVALFGSLLDESC